MGNKWGVIYNASGKDIVYAIHEKKMEDPLQGINKLEGQGKRNAITSNKNIFMVRADCYTTSALGQQKKDKYISFQYFADGKYIKTNHQIPGQKNLRVQINQQGNVTYLSQDRCEQLKKVYSQTINIERCGQCGGTVDCLDQQGATEANLSCMFCCTQYPQAIQVCNAQRHSICEQCTRILIIQKSKKV